jgi:hypothetical protein
VSGVLERYPGRQAAAAMANSARQFVTFATLDTECPEHCGADMAVYQTIQRHFPGEHEQFRASRQMTGTLPLRLIRRINFAAVIVSAALAAGVLVLALRRRDRWLSGLVLVVGALLVGNAMLAGALAGVHDRYQSRVIWLVPVVALLGLARLRASPTTNDRAALDQ